MDGKEIYLGDGLYASFDGFMITLRAPREDGDHWIGLEPEVFNALQRYVKEQYAQRRSEALRAKE
jgi:hypothetical protein